MTIPLCTWCNREIKGGYVKVSPNCERPEGIFRIASVYEDKGCWVRVCEAYDEEMKILGLEKLGVSGGTVRPSESAAGAAVPDPGVKVATVGEGERS